MKKYLLLGAAAMSMLIAAPAIAAPNNQSRTHAQTQHYQGPTKAQHHQAQRVQQRHRVVQQRHRAQQQQYRHSQRFYYNGRQHNSFRAPAWHAPRGHYQRSWARGQYLPASYRARPYIINHRMYGLRPAPRGYNWVRVNNDVFLVSSRTGYINNIVFSMFFR